MPRTLRRPAAVAAALVLVTAAPLAASASPPTPVRGPAIEALAPYDGQETCSPTIKPGTAALRSLLTTAYRGTGDLGIVRACAIGGTSEHKEGRAFDWAIDAFDPDQDADAKDMFAWLLATDQYGNRYAQARRLGIMYMIYNKHIWSAYNADEGWRPYTGPNPHVDHVHISLSWPGADKNTSYWTGVAYGVPSATVAAAAADLYRSMGGAGGVLGKVESAVYDAAGGGKGQDFEGGHIYWSADTGVHAVYGAIAQSFDKLGGTGLLGLPIADEGPVAGGRASRFEAGNIYWSPATGAHAVYGSILRRYLDLGGAASPLGLPTTDETAVTGGRSNAFANGRIYWSVATGAKVLQGEVLDHYLELGGSTSPLGLPTTDEVDVPGGRGNLFQRGRMTWGLGVGAHAVTGSIGVAYEAMGGPGGRLGLVTADEVAVPGGRMTAFRGGRVYWSLATGTRTVSPAVAAALDAAGGTGGPLGMPRGEEQAAPGGSWQPFAGGGVYTSGAGTYGVYGSIFARWQAAGGPGGVLGMPVSTETAAGAGRVTSFAGGRVFWSLPTGVQLVVPRVATFMDVEGGPQGYLGLPKGELGPSVPGAQSQVFSGAMVYVTADRTRSVRGLVLQAYLQAGGPAGRLGLPITNEYAVPGGRRSDFQRGSLTWSASTGQVTG